MLQYRELINPKVANWNWTGEKSQAVEVIQQAESRLHRSKLVGVEAQGNFQLPRLALPKGRLPGGKSCNREGEVKEDGGNVAAGHLDKRPHPSKQIVTFPRAGCSHDPQLGHLQEPWPP